MKHLISIRTNIMYSKDKEEEYKKFFELIFLVDVPQYRISTEGGIVRERGVEEQRFIVSESAYDSMMDLLETYRNAEPKDLQ